MKKKLIALVLAASAVMSSTALAAAVNAVPADNNGTYIIEQPSDTKAILMLYDGNGALVYSNLYKSADGKFSFTVPSQYSDTKKKVYFVDTKEFKDIEITGDTPAPTPAATEAPTATDKPASTEAPAATAKPTSEPSVTTGLYEKEVDGIYAPALVKEIETRTNSNNEDIYAVTLFYHGKEMTIEIESDLTISTAPDAYSYMKGQSMDSLEKGDVICMTANIAGDTIRTVDFIFRPTEEDIVTGDVDYGTSFEKLFASGGMVANKWSVIDYGVNPSSDRYQYAFGVIGRMSGTTLTLLNKGGVTDDALEIDVDGRANVYTCDVDGKEYAVEIGDVSDITGTIANSQFNKDVIELNDDYSYNYALVRMVDGTATDIVVYNNYNE